MKKLLLAAVLMVLAGPVWAQETFVHGQSGNPGFRVGTFVGGMASDSTGYIFRTDAYGSLYTQDADRDREASVLLSSGWADGDSISSGTRKLCALAVPVGDWNRTTVLVSWNHYAAADSDSVNVIIYPIAKVSTSMGDGQDYMMDLSDADTGLTPIYITRNANGYTNIANVRTIHAKTLAPVTGGSAEQTHLSSNAVAFSLSNNHGAIMPVPLLGLAVVNIGGKTLTNVNIDLWPRAW